MPQRHFFALKEDLIPLLNAIEKETPLRYIRFGQAAREEEESFACAAEIPDLGYQGEAFGSGRLTFLVTGRDMPITPRHIQTVFGDRYAYDQLYNPDTVTFSPGGIWDDGVLISGRVATVSDTPFAKSLMKIFSRELKKRFSKIKAFDVGPEASALLDKGCRLTGSVESPRLYDLTRD